MTTTLPKDLLLILLSRAIKSLLADVDIQNDTVDFNLDQVTSMVNDVAYAYRKTFNYPTTDERIAWEEIGNVITHSELSRIVFLHDLKITVEVLPQKFKSLLTGIMVDSLIRMSKVLADEINRIAADFSVAKSRELKLAPELKEGDAKLDELQGQKLDELQVQKLQIQEEQLPQLQQDDLAKVEITESAVLELPEIANETEPTIGESLEIPEPPDVVDAEMTDAHDVEDVAITVQQPPDTFEDEQSLTDKGEAQETEAQIPESPAKSRVEEKESVSNKEEAQPIQVTVTKGAEKRLASPMNDSHKHKRFQNIGVNLIKTIEEHRFSSPFLTPVLAAEYEQVVKEPRDLKSILKALKLKDGQAYQNIRDLERDIMLMFANCVMFNKSTNHLVGMAREMSAEVSNTFKMFEEAESQIL